MTPQNPIQPTVPSVTPPAGATPDRGLYPNQTLQPTALTWNHFPLVRQGGSLFQNEKPEAETAARSKDLYGGPTQDALRGVATGMNAGPLLKQSPSPSQSVASQTAPQPIDWQDFPMVKT